ncbi:hypothetical protein ACFQV2_32730 [Actinokineospora soli]|uniref:NB-ARC domain-containing protein n=1 Tax=Actinokineospora soli TaxID=1048753 RepID=A0ABW2TXH0_9PSEU
MTASPLDRGVVNAITTAGGVLGGVVQAENVVQAGSIGAVVVAPADARRQPPRQLPAPPRRFVNRAGELRDLDELTGVRDAPPLIVVLNGMSGVGKTAMGLHWARSNADLFPGGQLYVDLSFYRHAGGVAVHDVLGGLLIAMGVHEHFIPARLAERAALFRSRTAAQPVLVFVDDADQAAQVRPLVPGAAGSAVIVTSRNRLSGLVFDDAEFIDVRPLGPEESLRVLTELTPHRVRAELDTARTGAVLALCAGLPVAIRVAAARIARHGAAGLTAYLSDAGTRLDRLSHEERPMSRVFDTVVAGLPDHARRLYRCLGAHPGPDFATGAAAARPRSTSPRRPTRWPGSTRRTWSSARPGAGTGCTTSSACTRRRPRARRTPTSCGGASRRGTSRAPRRPTAAPRVRTGGGCSRRPRSWRR